MANEARNERPETREQFQLPSIQKYFTRLPPAKDEICNPISDSEGKIKNRPFIMYVNSDAGVTNFEVSKYIRHMKMKMSQYET